MGRRSTVITSSALRRLRVMNTPPEGILMRILDHLNENRLAENIQGMGIIPACQSGPAVVYPNNRYIASSNPNKNPAPPYPIRGGHCLYSLRPQTANAPPPRSSAHSRKQCPSQYRAAPGKNYSHSAYRSPPKAHTAPCSRSPGPHQTCRTESAQRPARRFLPG